MCGCTHAHVKAFRLMSCVFPWSPPYLWTASVVEPIAVWAPGAAGLPKESLSILPDLGFQAEHHINMALAWVLGIQTPALMPAQQDLYQACHFFNPWLLVKKIPLYFEWSWKGRDFSYTTCPACGRPSHYHPLSPTICHYINTSVPPTIVVYDTARVCLLCDWTNGL